MEPRPRSETHPAGTTPNTEKYPIKLLSEKRLRTKPGPSVTQVLPNLHGPLREVSLRDTDIGCGRRGEVPQNHYFTIDIILPAWYLPSLGATGDC